MLGMLKSSGEMNKYKRIAGRLYMSDSGCIVDESVLSVSKSLAVESIEPVDKPRFTEEWLKIKSEILQKVMFKYEEDPDISKLIVSGNRDCVEIAVDTLINWLDSRGGQEYLRNVFK